MAIDGENFEVNDMRPAYKAILELEEKKMYKSIYWLFKQKKFIQACSKNQTSSEIGNDIEVRPI